ncbi:adhesion G protein-coupled receptor A2 isoform X1 [Arvicanthis niloticus]|uniref:adhesion G protein-coupled receptor A2 isoform X1 n=1 Tax=Arvicanthis niloticus TaxID=61156 RepID=UPI001486FC31|nr:adhesion G protein-coupled receptor A2 isoform X1 [Arvicanthis niloticus]
MAPRPALGRPGLPLSTPPARPGPSGRRAVRPLRCRSPRGDGLMGAGGRRMPVPPARLLLLPLLPCLLLLAPGTRGAPGCPVPIRGCKCSGERPKGLSGSAHNPARRRVVCGGGDLPEPPDPGLLPNGTITLLLSNNKITGLRNGSFLGLSLLEKLDLRSNVISTVQPGAFLGLGELKRLDLSNNRIGCLTSETFQGLPRLLRLNISGNIYSSLQPGVFDELPALKIVDFGTEFLTCDCRLRWLLPWARNHSLQLSERTLCAYPSALHAHALSSLQESQLRCEGALELHTHYLIPSLRQVVFQGDRLPFQCSASYLGNDTRIHWYHNGAPMESDEQAGIVLAENLIHDCTFITSELTLSHIGVWASGEWECSVSTVQGNTSKKVEIVVLETSASYCPAERVTNNRGDFRWPRTLAGITAYQSCLQYPFTSVPLSGGAPGTRASRRCDRAGRWEPGDYSHCLYTNDITRVLYTFVLMPINASNALTLAHQLRVYTAEAASFSDMMDVVYVAQMIQKFLGYVDQIKELVEVMVDMASNLMLVDEHLLWLAQREDKACSGIVGALERIGGAALSTHAQHISVNSRNVALEAYLIKPHSYVGLTCTAFQRREVGMSGVQPSGPGQDVPLDPEPLADQKLRFRCTTGRPNISLSSFHIKNSVALASIQLPPSLFSTLPAALAPPVPPDCTLQLLVFRNGRLFRSHGNTSRPGAAGPGKRRGVATPVIFAGTSGCGVGNLTEPVAVSLRHWAEGADPMAAWWNQDGPGGWSSEGCKLRSSQPNVSSLYCQHLGNVAVLMELSAFPREAGGSGAGLHPVVYPCTALLLLCLFSTIITYILNHSSIHVSRKGWHMLLNLCFHMAMTSAVFVGGVTLTNYQMVCQAVGITLHYSSLSSLLWMGVKARVLHKELSWRAPPPEEGDAALPGPRPMLRFYLIAGGIPLIICGITAAVNIHNYRDHSPYCWLVWRPSLGAFYIPVALILPITWIYFLCAGLHLRGHVAQNPKQGNSRLSLEPGEDLRGSTRLRSSGVLLSDSGSLLATVSAGVGTPAPPEDGDGVYSPGVQLGALMTTHFLYLAMWACGALAVSQRWLPRVVCSCLYGVAASALGLFVFTHHCARRRDVRASWRACCPPTSPSASHAPPRALPAEDGSPVLGEGPASLKSSPSGSSGRVPPPPCKLTNLQVAQNQVCEPSVAARGDGEPEPSGSRGSLAPRHHNNLHHGRRVHKSRAKGHRSGETGGKSRLKALRAGTSPGAPELLSSESGSLHNSPTDSYPGSSRNSPGDGLPLEGEPMLTPSEGSDTSAAPIPEPGRPGQRRSASRDNLKGSGSALERESKRRSYPLNTTSLNGAPKGGKYEDASVTGAEAIAGGCMKTGLWKSETTV